jgi:hypothetical protein
MDILNQLTGSQGDGLSGILNQLFYAGLIIAVVLAIVMIIRGGIEYMTIDAASNKESAKNRIKAAIGGLVLCFSTILILNTINPGLTKLELRFPKLENLEQVELEGEVELLSQDILSAVDQTNALSNQQYQELIQSGKIPQNISPTAQRILAQALAAVGTMNTGSIPNTNAGALACAAAVNKIVELATGQQVGGGLSTSAMNAALRSNPRFVYVGSDYSRALPGDIIMTPTSGGVVGHVGIVATPGATRIISNSSSRRMVLQNHTASSWSNYYQNKKGLPVYFYRPI